jgi:tRNA wybutosine-synthesizing protein 1
MKNSQNIKKELEKKHYAFVGENAAVQICNWTKSALRGEGTCWKEKFYGISSAGCCQFSPNVMNCENKCLHCWRPIELNKGIDIRETFDSKELLDKINIQRKKLMRGFGGNKKTNKKNLEKSYSPSLYTLSLSGEPTLYPNLPELIKEIRSRNAVSFIVTNGQNPNMIMKLAKENSLPTQLTLSTNAPNKELFVKWHNSCRKDSWERFSETLNLFFELKDKCRRVIRLTLVKIGKDEKNKLNNIMNMSEENVFEYAKIIEKADPNFVHVKGFMSIGNSRPRGMTYDKQPTFDEVKEYAKKILAELRKKDKSWKILADEWRSVVVVLGRNKKEMKIKKV